MIENLKQIRKQRGLTLRDVEKLTGISNAYLSQLETGKIKKPSHHVVQLLSEALSEQLPIHSVMQGLPIDFVEWLGDHYIKMHGGWMPKYSNQIKTNVKTTMQLYEAYHALKDILNCPKTTEPGSPTVGNSAAGKGVSDGHDETHVTIRDGDFDYCMACNKQVPRA